MYFHVDSLLLKPDQKQAGNGKIFLKQFGFVEV